MFLYRVALRTLPVLAVALAATANAATPAKPAVKTVAAAAAKSSTTASATAKSASHNAASAQVTIENFAFASRDITVKAGTTVTWTNNDDSPHNVVAKDQAFKSKLLDTGDQFSYTFTKPGQFDYFCGLHPHMTGRVTVTG